MVVGMGKRVTGPGGVIRPILLAVDSVNQRLPSGPPVMPPGLLPMGMGNSKMNAGITGLGGVVNPTWLCPGSVNQRLPPAPAVIASVRLPTVGTGNAVI